MSLSTTNRLFCREPFTQHCSFNLSRLFLSALRLSSIGFVAIVFWQLVSILYLSTWFLYYHKLFDFLPTINFNSLFFNLSFSSRSCQLVPAISLAVSPLSSSLRHRDHSDAPRPSFSILSLLLSDCLDCSRSTISESLFVHSVSSFSSGYLDFVHPIFLVRFCLQFVVFPSR